MLCGKLHCQKGFDFIIFLCKLLSPYHDPCKVPSWLTQNPKLETRNPKPESETRNPKPKTQNPKPETRKPETLLLSLTLGSKHEEEVR